MQERGNNVAKAAAATSPLAGKAAILMSIECKVEDIDLENSEPLDWEFHPLQFGIGAHSDRYFIGCIVANLSLVACFGVMNYVVAWVATQTLGVTWEDAIYYVRAPGLAYIPMMWLLMGTSLSASHLAFSPLPGRGWTAVLGWSVLALCGSIPLIMWAGLLRPAAFHAKFVPDPRIDPIAAHSLLCLNNRADEVEKPSSTKDKLLGERGVVLQGWKRKIYISVYGKDVWVKKGKRHPFFVEQWGMFFEIYRGGYHWWSMVEVGQIVFLALASAWKPEKVGMCVLRNVLITLVLFAVLMMSIWLHPFNARIDHIASIVLNGLMFGSVLLISISLIISQSSGPSSTATSFAEIAGVMLLSGAVLMMLKGIYDFILYILDISLGRRRDAMKAARAEQILVDTADYDMTNIPCEGDSANQSEDLEIYTDWSRYHNHTPSVSEDSPIDSSMLFKKGRYGRAATAIRLNHSSRLMEPIPVSRQHVQDDLFTKGLGDTMYTELSEAQVPFNKSEIMTPTSTSLGSRRFLRV